MKCWTPAFPWQPGNPYFTDEDRVVGQKAPEQLLNGPRCEAISAQTIRGFLSHSSILSSLKN